MGIRRAAHVAWRRLGDETVLIHLKTKRIYVLNPSSGFFWHCLDGAHGTGEILDGLTLEAPLPENAAGELNRFFDELVDADLVEAHGSPKPGVINGNSNDYPLAHFVPPELVWQEQLRNFGQSCAKEPANAICDSNPTL